jgi:starvation-inducible DNA-binding protein
MTTEQIRYHIALAGTDVKTVADELQAELVDLIALALNAKQAHWNVAGPNFRSAHLQLDEIIEDLRQWSDTVAERLSTIGVLPDGRAATVAATAALAEMPAGEIRDSDAVRLFSDYLREFAARSRERAANAAADPVSQALIQDIIGGAEKHQWMLRAQTK